MTQMHTRTLAMVLVVAGLIGGADSSPAHEFWIAPQRHVLDPGARLVATLLVGRNLRGTQLPFLSLAFRSFTVTTPKGTSDVKANEGDIPALSFTTREPGLHVIAYHSTQSEAAFDDWGKFVEYLQYEGLEDIAAAHRARGLPDSGFKEVYSRFAKSLVQVGPVDGRDRDVARGLPLELVAQTNPYAAGRETMAVTLLRLGKPVAGRVDGILRPGTTSSPRQARGRRPWPRIAAGRHRAGAG